MTAHLTLVSEATVEGRGIIGGIRSGDKHRGTNDNNNKTHLD